MPAILAGAAVGAAPNVFTGTAAASLSGAAAAASAGTALGSAGMVGVFASNPVGWAAAAGVLGMKILPKIFGGGGTKKAVQAVGKEISALRDEMKASNAYDAAERQRQSWSLERAMANAGGGRNRFAPRPTEPAPVVGGGMQDQYRTPQGDTNWEYMFRRMVSGNDQNIGLS